MTDMTDPASGAATKVILVRHGESVGFGVSFGHHLRQGRDADGEPAFGLWFKDYREIEQLGHDPDSRGL